MLGMVRTPTKKTGQPGLAQLWAELQIAQPHIRIRDAAHALDVSELELLLCRERREPRTLRALRPEFPALLATLESMGEVMILSRNESVVHEVTGTYKNFSTSSSGAMGLALGQIDVRVFFRQWHYGYWVQEQVRSGLRESLQFFDGGGQAIQKIYRTENTRDDCWQSVIERFADASASAPSSLPQRQPPQRTRPNVIDIATLQEDWGNLRDVHHFNAMLRRHGTDRLTALELIGPQYARYLGGRALSGPSVLDHLLRELRKSRCRVMVFVGNPGIVQIFTGRITRVVPTGDWLNVLDPGFNLHVNLSTIEHWWRVRRPSSDGTVTSVEGYDANGELVITLFGARKPGQPEDVLWQHEVQVLETELCR